MNRFPLIALSCLLLSSCIEDFGEPVSYINFADLKIGQRSLYVRLHGYQYGDSTSNSYSVTPDTLVVTVIGRDETGFILEDHLTPFSQRSLSQFDTTSSIYHLAIVSDTVHVVGYSHLFWSFYFGGYNSKLQISPLAERRFTLKGWKISGDPIISWLCSGYVLQATVCGRVYPRANVYVSHNVADASIRPQSSFYIPVYGATYIYSAEFGIIRSRFVGIPVYDEGLCWDLLRY